MPLVRAQAARAHAGAGAVTEGRAAATAAEEALEGLPLPRRTQVTLALAWAWKALGDPDKARLHARTVLHTAGSRGFRLWALEARALVSHLSEGEDRALHRPIGQELARDFTSSLAPDLANAFMHRPFLALLDE